MTTRHNLERGVLLDVSKLPVTTVELFGHVTLVEGYALTNFVGCHALVALRDTPGKTVAVLTPEQRLQSLLETALDTGNLIAFLGELLANPPGPKRWHLTGRCLWYRRCNPLLV